MSKLSLFLSSFIKSLTSPVYYRDILRAHAGFSWKYFLFFHLILAALVAGKATFALSLVDPGRVTQDMFASYPAELAVKLDRQRLSINQPLPYVIPLPDAGQKDYADKYGVSPDSMRQGGLLFENMITFTSDELVASASSIADLKSWAVLTETKAYVYTDAGPNQALTLRTYPYPQTEIALEVSKQVLDNWRQAFLNSPPIKHKWYLPFFALVALVLVYPLIVLWRIMTLAIFSAFAWLMTKLVFSQKNITYGDLFRLGLHAITLIILIKIGLEIVGYPYFGGWLYLAAYLGWMGVIISQLPANTVGSDTAVVMKKTAAPKKAYKKGVKKNKK